MNFFDFDSKSRQLAIGDNFWIFIATWLPLTFVTAAIYILVLFLSWRKKNKKQFNWRWVWPAAVQNSSNEKLALDRS